MFDEREVCVARFCQLAGEFAKGSNASLLEEAGDLLVKAYRCGFIAVPGLAELVERAENRRQHEDPKSAVKVGLPTPGAQLFEDFAGLNEWPVELLADGVPEAKSFGQDEEAPRPVKLTDNEKAEIRVKEIIVAGDAIGGVVESQFFSGPKKSQTLLGRGAAILRHYALVLQCLAREIEINSPHDARDCWIYEQAIMGQKWQWIVDNMPDWCPDREQIATPNGVKKAAERYAKEHNLPPIPKRKRGRPRNTN